VLFVGKNRDRLSLTAAILEAAGSGANKTRIMFAANLSYKLLEKYLQAAIDAGFVRLNDSNYVITDSGRDFLRKYHSFSKKRLQVEDALGDLASERDRLVQIIEKRHLSDAVDSFRVK
jgi:predicted transcriptional regulator